MSSIKDYSFLYPAQFFLSFKKQDTPVGWLSTHLDSCHLYHCQKLHVTEILDSQNVLVGWILGFAITKCGNIIKDTIRSCYEKNSNEIANALDIYTQSLSGTFVAVYYTRFIKRVYADPSCQRSIVFNKTERIVASSLLLSTSLLNLNQEHIYGLNVLDLDIYYPFGITPDRNVKRLLPNHFLNLETFSTQRFWPPADIFFGNSANIKSTVEQISAKLKNNVQAIHKNFNMTFSLTAGRDSRMLLAVSKELISDIEFITVALPDKMADLDCKVAQIIANKFNLEHKIFAWHEASQLELDTWQKRVGYAVGGRTWKAARTFLQFDSSRVFLPGLCAEVGRASSWTRSDFDKGGITEEELLQHLRIPVFDLFLSEAKKWLADQPLKHRFDILDLAHIEQRLGCWAGPSHDGHAFSKITPFSDRFIFQSMMMLPYEYRFQQSFAKDLIKTTWPELLKIPFNLHPSLKGRIKSILTHKAHEYPRLTALAKKIHRVSCRI